MVLFHIPSEPMTSIAELQHVDFSSSVYAPAYAVGNSHANPWIPANQTAVSTYGLQDYSYLLNEALWDHYFFSTLETRSDGSVAPRNPRMKVIPHRSDTPEAATLLNPGLAAGHLLFDGPFNVNTDSVDAWAALLASGYQFPTRIQNVHSGTESLSVNTGSAFARSVLPSAGAVPNTDPVDANNEYWLGYRDLTDTQIRNLAGQIVYQIRQHGPFTSLAAFINRDLASTDADAQLKGLLQRAIDSQSVVTLDGVEYQPTGINPLPDSSNAVEAVNSALDYQYPQAALGLRSSMAPGYLTQADLLTKLGPQLTVRGDSFLIRAYGEAVDPISGAPVAFAQCEAIVQRLPEYLADPSQPPTEAANASNTTLGRKFEVVSFRWLNEESL